MLKPPICRVGGKSKLRKDIIDLIPEHTCYIELFFGAGWVYFGKETSKIEVINDIDKELIDIKERLSNIYVENLSFEKIIDKYDREHSFFFCDPPYFETEGYDNKFEEEEHIILRDKLKNLKGKFLLTINDHEKVRE